MIRTVEAMIDEHGRIQLLEPLAVRGPLRALLFILDEEPHVPISAPALLSETALTEDWCRPEEDRAWAHLEQTSSEDA